MEASGKSASAKHKDTVADYLARSHLHKDYDWGSILREEIYRQRIFGGFFGAQSLLEVSPRRHRTLCELILWGVTTVITLSFLSPTDDVRVSMYWTKKAIREEVSNTPMGTWPATRTLKDVYTISGLLEWTSYAFPRVASSVDKVFNVPLDRPRITSRRIKTNSESDSSDNRLKRKGGFDNKLEETDSFGAVRQLRASPSGPEFEWGSLPSAECDRSRGLLIDTQTVPSGTEATTTCRRWCESLLDPSPCRCVTLEVTGPTVFCEFYFMDVADALTDAVLFGHGRKRATMDVSPRTSERLTTNVEYPKMKKFEWSKDGYMMKLLPNGGIDKGTGEMRPLGASSAHRLRVEWDPRAVISMQVKELIAGGFFDEKTRALTIHIPFYNVLAKVPGIISVEFLVSGSGMVHWVTNLDFLTDCTDPRESGLFWAWIICIGFFVIIEMLEIHHVGLYRYRCTFEEVSMFITIALNILCAVSQVRAFKSCKRLESIEPEEKALVGKGEVSSLAGLFTVLTLIRYYLDVFHRGSVQSRSFRRALSLIAFVSLIAVVLVSGVSLGAYFLLGTQELAFSSIASAILTSCGLIYGEAMVLRASNAYWMTLFWVPFVIFTCLILQALLRSILITSFEDAASSVPTRTSHAVTRAPRNLVEVINLRVCGFVLRCLDVHFGVTEVPKAKRDRLYMNSRRRALIDLVFILVYIFGVFSFFRMSTIYELSTSIKDTLKQARFCKEFTVLNEERCDLNFDSIQTKEDVLLYLVQAFPRALFNSSVGTFDGRDNTLKYYSSTGGQVEQIVINNWNVVLGQDPVRISIKMFKMEKAFDPVMNKFHVMGGELEKRISSVRMEDFERFDSRDDGWTTNQEEVIDSSTREFLQMYHCDAGQGFGDDTGKSFVCSTSANYAKFKAFLDDFLLVDWSNQQLGSIILDFVVYNGGLRQFCHVAVGFHFQPCGGVTKKIQVSSVNLIHLRRGEFEVVAFQIAQLLIAIFTLSYFIAAFKTVWRTQYDQQDDKHHEGYPPRIARFFMNIVSVFLGNPFLAVDLTSGVSTITMQSMLLDFTLHSTGIFSGLSNKFRFRDQVLWNAEVCASHGWEWCSDHDVIREFARLAFRMHRIRILSGINLGLIGVRLLKHARTFAVVDDILSSLFAGVTDIATLLVTMTLFVFGYMFTGLFVSSGDEEEFGSFFTGYKFLLEVALQNRQAGLEEKSWLELILVFSYMAVINLVFINMAFGIVNFHFQETQKKRVQLQKEHASRLTTNTNWRDIPSRFWSFVSSRKSRISVTDTQDARPTVRGKRQEKGSSSEDGVSTVDFVRRSSVVATEEHSPHDIDDIHEEDAGSSNNSAYKMPPFTRNTPGSANWFFLPEEMRSWVDLVRRDVEKFANRVDSEKDKAEKRMMHGNVHALDDVIKDAEMTLHDHVENRERHVSEVKRSWQGSHSSEEYSMMSLSEAKRDQETVSWHIIKREAELKELDEKQRRLTELIEQMKEHAITLLGLDDPSDEESEEEEEEEEEEKDDEESDVDADL
eukprot:TRINITY_DN22169_c0_g1_i1.p1 TRINITY_DN22169_c0_g1~~TRINITY_DN22169_c0_g1_i1.p1  ORF type:complete len:1529 (-),score=253.37 TRINITY_DN22169_c0_g1_i1:49-4602(-)